ncbi:unnamed protein product [Vitrella brassicaformis CCMP3155]|uniref:Molybdate-anion transporter n=2 Tax=Vitrella brassicaformis TaxID=1169539 RepID=A0A0G4ENE9_VITBC|nr:unnamed protein product [Vitrella brassicaformis CCMP3155]|eukprot:CEL98527.1 unnamed protein product [Vitrella brassicaformis CCMP3155]
MRAIDKRKQELRWIIRALCLTSAIISLRPKPFFVQTPPGRRGVLNAQPRLRNGRAASTPPAAAPHTAATAAATAAAAASLISHPALDLGVDLSSPSSLTMAWVAGSPELWMFVCLAAGMAVVQLIQIGRNGWMREKTDHERDPKFPRFQVNFLLVYLLAMFADWLQGPYVYVLYERMGYDMRMIGYLFVVGFASSALAGMAVGDLADRYGRKAWCLLYSLFYILACLMYNINSLPLLFFGRFCAGVATSILFTTFDAWMVCEHKKRHFEMPLLNETYARATFGNGLVAIIAGVCASAVANTVGPVGPFDASIAVLIVLALVVAFTWTENYGREAVEDTGDKAKEGEDKKGGAAADAVSTDTGLAYVFRTFRTHPEVWWVGMVQSFFEAAMYSFVFVWTPALPRTIDQGIVFSSFMVAVMLGSNVFVFLEKAGLQLSLSVLLYVVVGAVSMLCAALALYLNAASPWRLLAFLLFELCCGVHFSAFYSLRARVLPEEGRATILNLYRVPLNLIVMGVCTQAASFPLEGVFLFAAFLLLCGAVFQCLVHQRVSKDGYTSPSSSTSQSAIGRDTPQQEDKEDEKARLLARQSGGDEATRVNSRTE